jgi:tRNA (mo5U34)-methyltransferase
MRHPLLALERVFSVTGRQLILETHVDMLWVKRPAMVFYPNAELHNDPTNWWGPNPSGVVAMLQSVGFREVRIVSRYHSRMFMLAAAAYLKMKHGTPFFETAQQDRMVFHALR